MRPRIKQLSLMYSVSSSHILSLQLSASTYETVIVDYDMIFVTRNLNNVPLSFLNTLGSPRHTADVFSLLRCSFEGLHCSHLIRSITMNR